MVRRVLVALDPDNDTPVAIRYAADIVRPCDGIVTGLALVAKDAIAGATAGSGIGSMYYAQKRRDELSAQTLKHAEELLEEFGATCQQDGVRFEKAHVAVGVPHEQITEHLKYHDLLVAGDESHFYYADPAKRTHALAKIAEQGAGAVLIVEKDHRPTERVLVAFDGGKTAARALQKFAQLAPFGTGVTVELVHVLGDDADDVRLAARYDLERAASYLDTYGFGDVEVTLKLGGNVQKVLLEHATESNADLIVAGAYSRSGIGRLFFGSTAQGLIEQSDVPLFMYH
ncbi:MAG: universal stress protein [Bacteroidota bacterium]